MANGKHNLPLSAGRTSLPAASALDAAGFHSAKPRSIREAKAMTKPAMTISAGVSPIPDPIVAGERRLPLQPKDEWHRE
jgi:hypothetical protein